MNVKPLLTLAVALLLPLSSAAVVTKLEGTIPGYKRDPALLILGSRTSVLSSAQIAADGKFSLSLPATVEARRLRTISDFFAGCSVKPTVAPAGAQWLNIASLPVSNARGVFGSLTLDSVTKQAKSGDVWMSWIFSPQAVTLSGSSTCTGKRSKTPVSSAWNVRLEPGWNLVSRTVNTVAASGIQTTYAAAAAPPANVSWKLAR